MFIIFSYIFYAFIDNFRALNERKFNTFKNLIKNDFSSNSRNTKIFEITFQDNIFFIAIYAQKKISLFLGET